MFLKGEFSNRLVQVSLFAGIVYYITAYPIVFESARKYFPIKFKKTHHLLIFHTFVFAVLMYVLTYFVFDPIVRVVEGVNDVANDGANGETQDVNPKNTDDGPFCNSSAGRASITSDGKGKCVVGDPGQGGDTFYYSCTDGQISLTEQGALKCAPKKN